MDFAKKSCEKAKAFSLYVLRGFERRKNELPRVKPNLPTTPQEEFYNELDTIKNQTEKNKLHKTYITMLEQNTP